MQILALIVFLSGSSIWAASNGSQVKGRIELSENYYLTNSALGLGGHATLTPEQWYILDSMMLNFREDENCKYQTSVAQAVMVYASVEIEEANEIITIDGTQLRLKKEVVPYLRDWVHDVHTADEIEFLHSQAQRFIAMNRAGAAIKSLQALSDVLDHNRSSDDDLQTLGVYFSRVPTSIESLGSNPNDMHPAGEMAGLDSVPLDWPKARLVVQ